MISQIHRRPVRPPGCLELKRTVWLVTLLSLLSWRPAGAQLAPPEQFFNSGAQFYISNNIPAALQRVEMGLKTYPDDEKLKKLEQLLKQQQQQQNQQQQNQKDQQQQDQKNQQSKNDQQKQSDSQKQKDQNQQDQQKKSDQQKQEEQKQSDQKKQEAEQKQQDQKKDSGDKPKDEKEEQKPAQPVKPGEMTPEEAKHLLDTQKGNEQLLQLKPDEKPRHPNRPIKDW